MAGLIETVIDPDALLFAGAFAALVTPTHPDSNATTMKTATNRTKDRTKDMRIY